MKKMELIICTEQGALEAKSRLLVYSLRNFGGPYKDLPIYSYQPRKDFPISPATIEWFEKHEVNYVDLNLNQRFAYYPLANKPIACAHREYHSSADQLLFMDSDIFFLRAPSSYDDFSQNDVWLRPVANKNIGAGSTQEPNWLYWQKLYELLGVKKQRRVRTVMDQQEIVEYYNSGQVACANTKQLFSHWLENFTKVMESGIRPNHGLFFVEQSTLSATISQLALNVGLLDKFYNIPIRRILDEESQYPIEQCVSIHYHRVFKKAKGENPLAAFLEKSSNGQQINERIKSFKLLNEDTPIRSIAF